MTFSFGKNIGRIVITFMLMAAAMSVLAACGESTASTDTSSQSTPTTISAQEAAPTEVIAEATPTEATVALEEATPAAEAPTETSMDLDMDDATPGAETSTGDDPPAPTAASTEDAGGAQLSDGQAGTGVTDVQATLREWAIDLSQTEVPAGTVRFTVNNAGQMRHNLTVTLDGSTLDETSTFAQSDGPQVLVLELKPGTYTIICDLPGHAQRGQKATLIVK